MSALLLLGLYFPTSVQGEFSKALLGANYLVAFILLALLARKHGVAGFFTCVTCLSIVPILLVFTITSHLNLYTPGALVGYAVLSLLLIVNLRNLVFPEWLMPLFAVVNFLNIAAVVAILVGYEPVTQFIVNRYSMFFPELVEFMLDIRKPVLTFGSHSLAGLFLYFFFFAVLQTYKLKGGRIFLIFAYCYVLAILSLLSVTGLVLGALALFQLGHYLWAKNRRLVLGTVVLMVMVLPLGLGLFVPSTASWDDLVGTARLALMSPDNGLSGRFGAGGTLHYNLDYLYDHPLSPVGVSYAEAFLLGDSGPIEYFLRGSIPLLLIVYVGFFYFLRRNLLAKSDAYLIFGVMVAFELGFTSLTNFRTLYLIPFFVAYLNGLRRVHAETG